MPRAKKKGASRTTLRLYDETLALAQSLGNGNKTEGIDRLFSKLPVFSKCLTLLQIAAEQPDRLHLFKDAIEAVILELEELEIERVHEEAIAEGLVERSTGVWIV